MTREEIVEGIIKQHERAAIYGDRTAAQRLHELLASCLRQGELTPYMTDLLAKMHEAIAKGENADAAMKTATVGRGHRIEETRKHDIYLFVESEWLLWVHRPRARSSQQPPTKKSLYAKAAKKFKLAKGTIENTYLEQRKKHGSLIP